LIILKKEMVIIT